MAKRLTRELAEAICKHIEEGVFPRMACQVEGVSYSTVMGWLTSPKPACRKFAGMWECAIAKARVKAEGRVFKEDPKFWLRFGPGRERRSFETGEMIEGWSEPARKIEKESEEKSNVVISPAFKAIHDIIASELAEHPELRSRVAMRLIEASNQETSAQIEIGNNAKPQNW